MDFKQKVAILGAGTMGPGIATIYALYGCKISMYYSDRTYAETLRERDIQLLRSVKLAREFMSHPMHNKKG